jgi:hypothetical protein
MIGIMVTLFECFATDNMGDYIRQLQRFNVGEDCPVFDGLFEFCQISASGSIGEPTVPDLPCSTAAHSCPISSAHAVS